MSGVEKTEAKDFDRRLSRLEATVESIAANVNSLSDSIRTMIQRDQTNWQSVFAGTAVLLTLVGAFMYVGVVRPQMWMMQTQEKQETAIIELQMNNAEQERELEWLHEHSSRALDKR